MDEAYRLEGLRSSDLPTDFGPFVLVRIVGHGSMGRVFEAERDGERVALKVIRPAGGAEYETFRKVLAKEAQLGHLLDHPSIVPTREFGEHKGVPWLALELVDGVDLRAVLQDWGALPPTVALAIAIQLGQALDHAHHLQRDGEPLPVVHRDIKPANVLLARGGRARLLDFGIAKAALITGLTTANGQTRGTPRYMSPEQTRGQELDGRSDLFGLAVVLYEMLVGRRLFEGSSLIEVMSSIVAVERTVAKPGLFTDAEAAVPGIEPILRRCLRADRKNRFERGAELVEALTTLLEDGEGPDLPAFVKVLLDGPDPDSSEREEWEALSEEVALSGAAIDSADVLRTVTGEHPQIAVEPKPAPPDSSNPLPPPPEPTTPQAQPRPQRHWEPQPPPRYDETDISQNTPGMFKDTEPSSQSLPPTTRGGPNPFAELGRAKGAGEPEAPIWWWLVGIAGVLTLVVLWWALG